MQSTALRDGISWLPEGKNLLRLWRAQRSYQPVWRILEEVDINQCIRRELEKAAL